MYALLFLLVIVATNWILFPARTDLSANEIVEFSLFIVNKALSFDDRYWEVSPNTADNV